MVLRVGAAMPAVGGEDWLLPSFLGPVLGGTALAGGFVSVVGTILGAALVTVIRSGLLVLDIGNFWLQLFLGLFLLAAVLVQRYGGLFSATDRRGMTLRRLLNAEWVGLVAASCSPAPSSRSCSSSFLTDFNIYVMLRSACVGLLVAFSQMIVLAVGQMNLSVGALGGLVAILFGAMMEVFGVPLASPCRWPW